MGMVNRDTGTRIRDGIVSGVRGSGYSDREKVSPQYRLGDGVFEEVVRDREYASL